jgi:hypothetical protein
MHDRNLEARLLGSHSACAGNEGWVVLVELR